MSSKLLRKPAVEAPLSAPLPLEIDNGLPAVTRNDKAMPAGLNDGLRKAWREFQRFNNMVEACLSGKTAFSIVDYLRDNWRLYTGADYPSVPVPVCEVATAIRYIIMKRGYTAVGQQPTALFEQNMIASMAAACGVPVADAGFGARSLEQRKYEEESIAGRTVINLNTKEANMAAKKTQQQPVDSVETSSKATQVLNMAATLICARQHSDEEIVAEVNAVHGAGALTPKKVGRVRRRINNGKRVQYGFEKPKEAYCRLVRVDGKLVAKSEASEAKASKPSSAVSRSILSKATGGAIGTSKAPRQPVTAKVAKVPAPSVQRPVKAAPAKAAPAKAKAAPAKVVKKSAKGK
jgi:hypothetical protein